MKMNEKNFSNVNILLSKISCKYIFHIFKFYAQFYVRICILIINFLLSIFINIRIMFKNYLYVFSHMCGSIKNS